MAGSLASPLLLGMIVGCDWSRARRRRPAWPVSVGAVPWPTPFALGGRPVHARAVRFLAAVYLTVEAEGDRRAAGGLSPAGIGRWPCLWGAGAGERSSCRRGRAARSSGPSRSGAGPGRFTSRPALAAVTALLAIGRRRYRLARLAAAAQVALVVLGWGASLYPFVVVPDLTLAAASAPRATQTLLLATLGAGALVLFPSLRLLFSGVQVAAPLIRSSAALRSLTRRSAWLRRSTRRRGGRPRPTPRRRRPSFRRSPS